MVKKINLREVIVGNQLGFRGGENGQLKRLAEFEVLVLVPEACFQGTAVLPGGCLCLRGKLDFTEALALVDILTFQGYALGLLGQNQAQGDGILEIMIPIDLDRQNGGFAGLEFKSGQTLEDKGSFLDPQDERQVKMSKVQVHGLGRHP